MKAFVNYVIDLLMYQLWGDQLFLVMLKVTNIRPSLRMSKRYRLSLFTTKYLQMKIIIPGLLLPAKPLLLYPHISLIRMQLKQTFYGF